MNSSESFSGYGTPATGRNFDALIGRLRQLELQEPIAHVWEHNHGRRSELDSAQEKRLTEVEQWYLRELGVHPAHREKLKEKIVEETLSGCRHSLQEVLAEVDQSSNIER